MELRWKAYTSKNLELALSECFCLYAYHHPADGDRPFYIGKAKYFGPKQADGYKASARYNAGYSYLIEGMLRAGYTLYIAAIGQDAFPDVEAYEQELIAQWQPIRPQRLKPTRKPIETQKPWLPPNNSFKPHPLRGPAKFRHWVRMSRLHDWAKELKKQTLVVYFAARDPRTPWYARLLALGIAAYALSPIDLIPDFIPVLGYLDDLLIVPLGLMLVLRVIPHEVRESAHAKAGVAAERPTSRGMAVVIVAIWVIALGAAGLWVWQAAGI